jgi:hypothetical protein
LLSKRLVRQLKGVEMSTVLDVVRIVAIGAGATAVMDAWLALQQRMGARPLDFALVGRWVGNMRRGEFAHAAIANARPVRGERALGWLTHYAVGIAFAALLVAVAGPAWLREPTLAPALLLGVATVVAPLFVMQPAMGAGFAASRTPQPAKSRLRSVVNHTVFGAGLYVTAAVIDAIVRLQAAR